MQTISTYVNGYNNFENTQPKTEELKLCRTIK